GGERRREARDPALRRGARLPTSANRDALGDPPAQVRRARRSQDFGQLARVLTDEDLAHALARSDEHVDRKRIEHLVRENDSLDRGEVVGHGCPAEIASLEREGLLRAETRRYLDDRRTRASRGFGALALERQRGARDAASCRPRSASQSPDPGIPPWRGDLAVVRSCAGRSWWHSWLV